MGFRGEALSSIAAVSKVELVTAQEGQNAVRVEVEGGAIRNVGPASRSPGTTISIRSLFYNVPARKKFQKSLASSTTEIHKLLFSLSLAHPEVGFELVGGDSLLLSVDPEIDASFLSNLEQRLDKLFHASFLQGRRPVAQAKNGYELHGWIGSPVDDRINRSGQYLFINRRAVLSPLVSSAVKAGYGHRLDERRYPIFVLHLTVPPEEIDVNVHPQKKEVRFQKEEELKQFLQAAISNAFQETAAITNSFQEKENMPVQDVPLRFREETSEQPPTWILQPEVIGLYENYLLLDASTIEGQEEGIIWVNLQKAREFLLLKSLQNKTAETVSQGLLIPIPLSLNKEQQKSLEEKRAILHDIGFSIEMSGKDLYLIHAIPSFIDASEAIEAVELILEGEEVFKNIAAFAVRGKKRFMIQEALAIWHQIKEAREPAIIAKTGPYDIKSFFK
jgi:DNA mismatch repair protein MutL